jgi:N-acetyl-gamma-glutamyl-phosphate reductase
LLAEHPEVEVASVTGRSQVGKRLPEVFPHLWSVDLPVEEEVAADVDVVLSALPHAAAAETLATHVAAGTPVIDCSADFRLHNVATYEQWYGDHPKPGLLPGATYGLPELHRDAIRESRLVAVPGCYPTASILGLAPLAAEGWLISAIVDAKSGVSGAGRALKLTSHFSEVDENLSAYGLAGHRHQPEMVQELSELKPDGDEVAITFVPHLIPMVRGILATCYPTLRDDVLPTNSDDAREVLVEKYRAFYADHPFVHVTDGPPSTKQTMGSNACLIYPNVDRLTGQVSVIACIDNLVKGAAGGAVQCLNLMLGLEERAGLTSIGLYP